MLSAGSDGRGQIVVLTHHRGLPNGLGSLNVEARALARIAPNEYLLAKRGRISGIFDVRFRSGQLLTDGDLELENVEFEVNPAAAGVGDHYPRLQAKLAGRTVSKKVGISYSGEVDGQDFRPLADMQRAVTTEAVADQDEGIRLLAATDPMALGPVGAAVVGVLEARVSTALSDALGDSRLGEALGRKAVGSLVDGIAGTGRSTDERQQAVQSDETEEKKGILKKAKNLFTRKKGKRGKPD